MCMVLTLKYGEENYGEKQRNKDDNFSLVIVMITNGRRGAVHHATL